MYRSWGVEPFSGIRLCSLLAVLAVGCSKGGDPNTVPVSGKVTYQGQSVEGAAVTFASTGAGRPVAALTTADGTYTLQVQPGSYVALVTKFEVAVINPEQPATDLPPKQLLPIRYGNPTDSPLKFEVGKGQPNAFDLTLTD
ncbi:MAG TPA: carboxypeptidase-like regulatory domain-containing protein [Pirellulales bacterium]|nr:carboxypeptidase-like regulatory domain-containing protein [Pirellulales bacterium]